MRRIQLVNVACRSFLSSSLSVFLPLFLFGLFFSFFKEKTPILKKEGVEKTWGRANTWCESPPPLTANVICTMGKEAGGVEGRGRSNEDLSSPFEGCLRARVLRRIFIFTLFLGPTCNLMTSERDFKTLRRIEEWNKDWNIGLGLGEDFFLEVDEGNWILTLLTTSSSLSFPPRFSPL